MLALLMKVTDVLRVLPFGEGPEFVKDVPHYNTVQAFHSQYARIIDHSHFTKALLMKQDNVLFYPIVN